MNAQTAFAATIQRLTPTIDGSVYPGYSTAGTGCADGCPQMENQGIVRTTIQKMLLTADNPGHGKKIYVLPAWPQGRDVSFKLHAPLQTTVELEYKAGKIGRLVVTPAARKGDVVLPSFLSGRTALKVDDVSVVKYRFNLAPAPSPFPTRQAYYNSSSWSWGGALLHVPDDPRGFPFHLYAEAEADACGVHAWGTNARVVHAVSKTAEGPFHFSDHPFEPFQWRAGPDIARAPDGTFLLMTMAQVRCTKSVHDSLVRSRYFCSQEHTENLSARH